MNVETVKWIAACVLFILTFAFSTLPLFLVAKIRRASGPDRRDVYARSLSLLSCCGGGVFLATCLLHLFPNVQKQMAVAFLAMKQNLSYPVAEFLLAIGFLIVLITEQAVLSCQQQNQGVPFLNHQHTHEYSSIEDSRTDYGSLTDSTQTMEQERSVHTDLSSHSTLRSAVLVLALSLHSVFEGLTIGLQSNADNTLRILAAVLIHKSIIAFTLGLNLTHSKFSKSVIIRCNLLFSITSPTGTMIGTLISNMGSGFYVVLTSAILQGLAAGTFVYVTFFEVLPHEFNSDNDRMLKVLSLLVGFSTIALLIAYVPS